MKKLFSICLTFVIACCCLASPAFAEAPETMVINGQVYTADDTIDLASSIWPEYEEKLRNPQIAPQTRSFSEDPVVIEKHEQLDEGIEITYIEKASGIAAAYITHLWTPGSSWSQYGGIVYNGTIFAAMGGCSCTISDFRYVISSSGYDWIDSYGSAYTVSTTYLLSPGRQYEDASGPATCTMFFNFYDSYTLLILGSTSITISVGNNNFSFTHA